MTGWELDAALPGRGLMRFRMAEKPMIYHMGSNRFAARLCFYGLPAHCGNAQDAPVGWGSKPHDGKGGGMSFPPWYKN
jgi:hypothetical protein